MRRTVIGRLLLGSIALVSAGCRYNFERTFDGSGKQDVGGPGFDTSTDLSTAHALCADPSLLMHVPFENGSATDRIGNETPSQAVKTVNDGRPAEALVLAPQDDPITYKGQGNIVAGGGTVMVWIKPGYDPSAIANDTIYYIVDARFATGYLRLVHRHINGTAQGIGVEAVGAHGTNEWDKIWFVLALEQGFKADLWVHLAATFKHDPTTQNPVIALYVDGKPSGSNDPTTPGKTFLQGEPQAVALGIKPNVLPFAKSFKGRLDEVMVFSKALDASDIGAIFDLQSHGDTCR